MTLQRRHLRRRIREWRGIRIWRGVDLHDIDIKLWQVPRATEGAAAHDPIATSDSVPPSPPTAHPRPPVPTYATPISARCCCGSSAQLLLCTQNPGESCAPRCARPGSEHVARLLQERQQLRAPRVMPQVLSFFGSNLREANVTIDTLLFFAQPGARYQHTAAQGGREAAWRGLYGCTPLHAAAKRKCMTVAAVLLI